MLLEDADVKPLAAPNTAVVKDPLLRDKAYGSRILEIRKQ